MSGGLRDWASFIAFFIVVIIAILTQQYEIISSLEGFIAPAIGATAAYYVAPMIVAAATNVLTQQVMRAIGAQQNFDWSQLAVTVITAGLMRAIVGAPTDTGGIIVQGMISGAISNTLTQSINVYRGKQSRIQWEQVAKAAAISSILNLAASSGGNSDTTNLDTSTNSFDNGSMARALNVNPSANQAGSTVVANSFLQ
ncbi:hypothetical protein, partial [Parvibium lacunae]|uniref:hypothetical protein n=1 Tax=Parvibium lacunae TaxID=1888893 RepID=UPI0019604FEA